MAIEELIRDTTPKGLHRANWSSRRNGYEIKPEAEWIFVEVEPIVSEELWEACNRTLMSRKSARRFPARARNICSVAVYRRRMYARNRLIQSRLRLGSVVEQARRRSTQLASSAH